MQTKLKAFSLVLAVSLSWMPPRAFAATHATKAQKNAVSDKPQFVASHKHLSYHSHRRRVPVMRCDLHMCEEKPRLIGTASYYGRGRQGAKMADGKRFDYRKMTVALWWLPLGTQVRVTNLENGKSVVVTVTDRGPAHALHRIADLSYAAASALDYIHAGTTAVLVMPVEEIQPEAVQQVGDVQPPSLDALPTTAQEGVDAPLESGIIKGYGD